MRQHPKGKTFTQLELDNMPHNARLIEPAPLGSILGDCRISPKTGRRSITWTYRFTSPTTKKEREIGCGTWPKAMMRDIRAARDAHSLKVKSGIDPLDMPTIPVRGIVIQPKYEDLRGKQPPLHD